MIEIFTGDDRVRASQEIKKTFGDTYEVIDCSDLTTKDLPSIFLGTTLFGSKRNILLRDFTANSNIYPELKNYVNTPHHVILLETKLDKRTTAYKDIKDKVRIAEFKLPPSTDFRIVFNIYNTAKIDGSRAIDMLESIKSTEDPIMFMGLLISQALKDYKSRQGIKERQILKELSSKDMQMKSSKIDPWLIVESFLLSLSSL